MSGEGPTTSRATPPTGAVFYRCALQVNPHHYGGTFRGESAAGDAESYAKAIVAKAAEIGVSVLAVTDHNSVSGVVSFQKAAEGSGITVFPGFELTSREGIHVLCIYPHNTQTEQLDRFLGGFGIQDTEPSSDLSENSLEDIIAKVSQQRGITIAAHVKSDKGLFKVLSGQARIRAWKSQDLLAIQIPRSVEDLPQDIRGIVENKNLDYRRDHPASKDLAVAAVNASDVMKPADLDNASATCWIKMSKVTTEGLRQAFLDPQSRIRLNSDPVPDEHAELVAATWHGGFLDGVAVHLNPNLNVLVGGRGAGKSAVIESLRYVLGLNPIGEEARKAHEGIVRHVLRGGTKVSLTVRSLHPSERRYRIERTVPNPPIIRDDETGQVSNLQPEDILPGVEVYGQHEISELAKSPEKLTRLLDRFTERDPSLPRRKDSLRRDLAKARRSILDIRSELQQIEERLAVLPGLEETLGRFRDAGLEDRLHEQSLLIREERVLESILERLQVFRDCADSLRQETPVDRVFLSPRALKDLPGREILAGADEVLQRLSDDIRQTTSGLDEALKRADEGIADIRSKWRMRKDEVQAAYEQILRELGRSAVDGEEFIRLRRDTEVLRPLRERHSLLRRLDDEHWVRRRSLLADWEDTKAREFRRLARAARKVNKKLEGRVRADVTASVNLEPLFQLLRSEVGGHLSSTVERLKELESLSLMELADACRKGAEELRRRFRLTPAQARNIAEAAPDVAMRIEELELPSATEIQLNTAPPGEAPSWQALEDLSIGQKATAVLLLLLLDSDAPLIVDQPEDDLDNRFITEGVVPRMREEKQRRQFVFSTHNANIPVLGDAELIIGLTASGAAEGGSARVAPEHMGSIDSDSIRELVEEILEGGRNAFETRRRKYGF